MLGGDTIHDWRQMIFKRTPLPESTGIELDGALVSVAVRTHARARNYRLTISRSGEPVLTLPPNGRWSEAEAFLNKQRHWLAARLKRAPRPVAFADGTQIPLRGEPHVIEATGQLRGQVSVEDGRLLVPGSPEHMARRLTDWLKKEARSDLSARSAYHAERLGVKIKTINLKSQATRWGSCSTRGNLNYNWRLILAPPFVLDYVAAHEVAHMREMNHSPAFWDRVSETLPDMERGRAWLKAHGAELMVYGL